VRQLKLKHKVAEYLLLRKPKRFHYRHLVRDEAVVYKEDGSVLVRLVKNAIDPLACKVAYSELKNVDGALSARASVLGTKLMPRTLRDGSLSRTVQVPAEVVAKYHKRGARADFLGFKEAEPRFQYCRQTAWSRKHPEVLRAAMPLIRAADCMMKIEFPSQWESQHDHVSTAPDFRIGDTAFSTLTVNKNLATTYHRDEGDYANGFGVMLSLGEFEGGYLCFPEYGVAVDYRPGDVILADVHSIHGNLPIRGDRVVCVLYAREKINPVRDCRRGMEEGEIQGRRVRAARNPDVGGRRGNEARKGEEARQERRTAGEAQVPKGYNQLEQLRDS
jgi:hypothetical protein